MAETTFAPIARAPSEGFDIDQFKAYIEKDGGLQRTNKFLVRLWAAPFIQSDPFFMRKNRELEFYCLATSLPGYGLALHEVARYGHGLTEKKPFAPTVSDITCVFFSDAGGIIHKYFTTWQNNIINKDYSGLGRVTAQGVGGTTIDQFEVAYKTDYMTNIQITTFSDSGKVSNCIRLQEAFPVAVADVQLNWGENNNIMAIPVTFSYYSWYSEQFNLA